MRHIYEKTRAASRTELALLAIQNGWVQNPAGPEAAPAESSMPPATRPAVFLVTLSIGYVLFSQPAAAETPPPPSPLSFQSPTLPTDAQAGQTTGRWTLYPPLTIGRAGLGLAFFEGRLFAIGGTREGGLTTRLVEVYDPGSERWTEGATKPHAASNISAAVLGDPIYVPGGCNNDTGQALDVLDIYDPTMDRRLTAPALPGPCCAYGLAAGSGYPTAAPLQLYGRGGARRDSLSRRGV